MFNALTSTMCRRGTLITLASLSLIACGPTEEDNNSPTTTTPAGNNSNRPSDMLEVTGKWASQYGTEEITTTKWDFMNVVYAHNEENWAVTQNPIDAEFNPNTYNRIHWTEIADGSFYYCTVAFNLTTEDEAKASAATADDTDPENSGCGDFPWTRLFENETLEVTGMYTGDFGGETISTTSWTGFNTQAVVHFNNVRNIAVRQNPPDDQFNPDKFNRVHWLEPAADGSFYYCIDVISTDTLEEARDAMIMADSSDPDNGGCGDFPWTKLTVAQ